MSLKVSLCLRLRASPWHSLSSCLLSLLAMATLPALAQSEDDLRKLDQRCEDARQAALAPIRAKLLETCVKEKEQQRSVDPRQECAAEVSTYGNSRTGGHGNVVPGLFYDLPECMQAQAAWEQWKRNRPWNR